MSEELPKGWAAARIGDVAQVRLGRQRSPSNVDGPHQRPYLRAANVTWDGLDLSDVKSMNFAPPEDETYRLRNGDIVLSEASGSIGEVGKPAIWRDEIPGACLQNTLIRVRSRGPSPEYLLWRFRFDALRGAYVRDAKGIGIHHLGAERFADLDIPLPPLAEQRRIVAKLDALFERSRRAKASLDRIPAMLERLRQSILAAAFRGDLTKEWREAHPNVEPASVLLERIRAERRRKWEEDLRAKGKDPRKAKYEEPAPVDAEGLPELPEGWAWATVEEQTSHIVDCLHRTPVYVEEGYPAIRTADVIPGRILLGQARRVSEETYSEQIARLAPAPGDVLYTREGERFGLAAVVPDDVLLCMSQRMMQFRVIKGVVSSFFMWALNSPIGYGQAVDDVGGSTSPHVNIRSIRKFHLPIAPHAEQLAIADAVEKAWVKIDATLRSVQAELQHLGSLERATLAKAFRGELVPQDPNDEPAAELLARIRAEREAAGTKPARGRKRAAG